MSVQFLANAENDLNDRVFNTPKTIQDQIDVLADSCWKLRQDQPTSAIKLAQIALNLASESKTSHLQAKLNNYIGAIYLNYLHDIYNSAPYFEKALHISLSSNDTIELGYAYNNLGDLYYKTNNLLLAIKYDTLSYHLFQKINFKEGIAYSLTNMGEAFQARKEYDKALYYFQLLYEIEYSLNNLAGISFSLLQIGQVYFQLADYENALDYYNKAYALTSKLHNRTFQAKCLTGLANYYLVKKDFTKCKALIDEAIQLNFESNYIPGIIENKLDLALLLSLTNHHQSGEKYLQDASVMAYQLGFPNYILTVKKKKVEFYSNLNNYSMLNKAYDEYFSVYDSLYAVQTFENLNEMQKSLQSQFIMERLESDLNNKKKEKGYMYSIIALLLLLGLLLFWRYRTIFSLNKNLKETNATKDKLFTIISHDLKSPFNSILGMCELLNEELDNKNYDLAQKHGLTVQKTAEDTFKLLNNLLNWSKSQLSEIKIHPERLDTKSLIDQAIELYKRVAEAKNIQVLNHVNDVEMTSDKNSMIIVISNLLSNALKFTPNNGKISFSAAVLEKSIQIRITDTGIGIPDHRLRKLFDLTENESTNGTNNEKGTGLGLVLCKQFVELNGGELSVESSVNRGSTFIIEMQQAK